MTAQPFVPLFLGFLGVALPFYAPNVLPGIIFGFLFVCLAVAFFYRFVFPNFQWVRVTGDRITAKQFYTRRVYDRAVTDIDQIVGLGATMKSSVANKLADDVLGSLRGYHIRFKDGLVVPIGRMEMTHADDLVLHLVNDHGVELVMHGNVT
ncbi:MAG: hypothetical protein AAF394_13490 [Planctomycetota bacterium]